MVHCLSAFLTSSLVMPAKSNSLRKLDLFVLLVFVKAGEKTMQKIPSSEKGIENSKTPFKKRTL